MALAIIGHPLAKQLEYRLLHGGPLSEAELRNALGLSHNAAFSALAECEGWGLREESRAEANRPARTGASLEAAEASGRIALAKAPSVYPTDS